MEQVPERQIEPPLDWQEEPDEDEEDESEWYDWFDPRGVRIV